MPFLRNYPLLFCFLLLITVLMSSFLWTNIPGRPMVSGRESVPEFRFVFVPDGAFSVPEVMRELPDVAFVTAHDRQIDHAVHQMTTSFYPLYDGTSPEEQFLQKYPYLPQDQLKGYGNSVYPVDYSNIRMYFLNAPRLMEQQPEQLGWVGRLSKTLERGQKIQIAYLSADPKWPSCWQQLKEAGIHLTVAGGRIYLSDQARQSLREKDGLIAAAQPGWFEWEPSVTDEASFIVLEGNQESFTVRALDGQFAELAGVTLRTHELQAEHTSAPLTFVPMQAQWRYNPGKDVQAFVPGNGYDLTGEQPVTQSLQLPPADWRHPDYDDRDWKTGTAPFGHTSAKRLESMIQQWLPVEEASSYVFRTSFTLAEDPSQIESLLMHIAFEDGFIAYLNGEEIASDFMPSGLTDYRTKAVPNEFQVYQTYDLTNHRGWLRAGRNVIAVQVHRSHPRASHLIFDLSLTYRKGEQP